MFGLLLTPTPTPTIPPSTPVSPFGPMTTCCAAMAYFPRSNNATLVLNQKALSQSTHMLRSDSNLSQSCDTIQGLNCVTACGWT